MQVSFFWCPLESVQFRAFIIQIQDSSKFDQSINRWLFKIEEDLIYDFNNNSFLHKDYHLISQECVTFSRMKKNTPQIKNKLHNRKYPQQSTRWRL